MYRMEQCKSRRWQFPEDISERKFPPCQRLWKEVAPNTIYVVVRGSQFMQLANHHTGFREGRVELVCEAYLVDERISSDHCEPADRTGVACLIDGICALLQGN